MSDTVVEFMSNWVNATVIENKHWTQSLYSLRVEGEIDSYKAGQFGRLGLQIEDQIVGRPYSFVSAPNHQIHEFYSIVVEEGPLSPLLAQLKPGDPVYLDKKPNGFFTLDELPDSKHLWMLSTGTGIGPYLSILQTETPWQRFEKIVLVHAVRNSAELTYRELIDRFSKQDPEKFNYVPFVSREETDFAMHGRIPAAISDGRLENRTNIQINADQSQVMICGNPEMVKDTRAVLQERGLAKNLRRKPGNITTENYW